MKNFFETIAFIFEEYLFAPLDFLRHSLGWWGGNFLNVIFMIVGLVAITYWVLRLIGYNKNDKEDRSVTSHSFLK